jgi:ABC-2 type transport system permease protein
MKHVAAIAGRELRSMFSTPVAYVVLASYLAFSGFIFFVSLAFFLINVQQIQAFGYHHLLEQFNLNDMVIGQAFGTFALTMIVVVPALCMRTLSQERSTGTIELHLTSPISSWELVLGKYLAVMCLVALVIVLSGAFPLLLFIFGNPELWQTLAGLLTLLMYAAATAALCCFISALTRDGLVAVVLGIIVCFVLMVLPAGAERAQSEVMKGLLEYLGTSTHFEPGLRGHMRLEDMAYFGAMVVIFLSLSRATIESLRWR